MFNFLYNIIEFAAQSFGNFITTFTILLLTCIGVTVMLSEIVKFRLFTVIRTKNKEVKEVESSTTETPSTKTEHQNTIYDLLVDAYDRYLNKKGDDATDDKI